MCPVVAPSSRPSHECPKCNTIFSTASNMRRHRLRKHPKAEERALAERARKLKKKHNHHYYVKTRDAKGSFTTYSTALFGKAKVFRHDEHWNSRDLSHIREDPAVARFVDFVAGWAVGDKDHVARFINRLANRAHTSTEEGWTLRRALRAVMELRGMDTEVWIDSSDEEY